MPCRPSPPLGWWAFGGAFPSVGPWQMWPVWCIIRETGTACCGPSSPRKEPTHEDRTALPLCHHRRPGDQARPGGPPLGVRQRDYRPGGHPGGRRPLRRAQPQGPVPGHGVLQLPLENPGAAALPKRQRQVRPGLFRPAGPVRLGLPQNRHGPGRGQLPRHFWGGRPLPRPDRGQVRGHFGHPDAVPGHRAAQGLDFPCPGAGHGGRRPAHPGDLPAQRREDTGAGRPGAEQGLVPPGGQAPPGIHPDGDCGKRHPLPGGL